MLRKETDGSKAYKERDIFHGEVVLHDENCGYWGSSVKDKYPNPFLVKLCKRMWQHYP
jgi:hypothetical protein